MIQFLKIYLCRLRMLSVLLCRLRLTDIIKQQFPHGMARRRQATHGGGKEWTRRTRLVLGGGRVCGLSSDDNHDLV